MKKVLLIIFIIIIVLIGLVFGAFYYFFKVPAKNIDVSWTEQDYASGIDKSKVKLENIDDLNLLKLISGDFVSEGSNPVSSSWSNEEISAILSKTNNTLGPIEDIKVRFLDNNEVETTFKLKANVYEYFSSNKTLNDTINSYGNLKDIVIGSPIYVKAKLDSASGKTVDGSIQEITLGNLSMPANVVSEAQTVVVPMINTIISNYEGFSVNKLSFEKDKLNFDGTLSNTVSGK